jgi:SpoVK/Ycf46/Vps4 family AAA+-type ATPase
MRTALRTAERVAPCILWIDEIEKAFGRGGDSDGGTAHRILGSFLTWLQEKSETVFVMATANDISDLPPELLRKGRFDEIFFVDLPSHEVREHIFALHLAARRLDPSKFDLSALSAGALGFSGAEIEQAVVSGLYSGLSLNRPLDTELLLRELEGTQPLSVTMAEKVEALRTWARERAVFVD